MTVDKERVEAVLEDAGSGGLNLADHIRASDWETLLVILEVASLYALPHLRVLSDQPEGREMLFAGMGFFDIESNEYTSDPQMSGSAVYSEFLSYLSGGDHEAASKVVMRNPHTLATMAHIACVTYAMAKQGALRTNEPNWPTQGEQG